MFIVALPLSPFVRAAPIGSFLVAVSTFAHYEFDRKIGAKASPRPLMAAVESILETLKSSDTRSCVVGS
jgi:hypothetical protein